MAEHSTQERTEQPTQKRLKEAREKGQVPRSKELSAMAVSVVGAAAVYFYSAILANDYVTLTREAFEAIADVLFSSGLLLDLLAGFIKQTLILLIPLFAILTITAVLASIMLGGWNFSFKALAPKIDKLNPVNGLKRVFGPQGLMEMLKAVAKFLLIALGAIFVLYWLSDDILKLGDADVFRAIASSGRLIGISLVMLTSVLAVIAAIDVPFQIWNHMKQLRMTRQEVRDELSETEGRPEVRGRIRNLQRELSGRRMIEAVPAADVVVTNPTHFSVALKYDPESMRAPQVVASGADLLALRIREVARLHSVPMLEAPLLARALYRNVRPGDEVPERLYLAVAQVMTWVYRLRREGVAEKPQIDAEPWIDMTGNRSQDDFDPQV